MTLRRLILLLLACSTIRAETLPSPRRLNNLVVEILNLSGPSARGIENIRFTMPHDGWVYISARATAKSGERVFLSFDNENNERLGLSLNANSPAAERQSFLTLGDHVLHVHRAGEGELAQLILRRVPEIAFSKFGPSPRTLSAGDHDWDFLSKFLLPHVNTIIGIEAEQTLPYLRQWKSRGGRWFVEEPRTIDPSKAFGYQNPHVDGVIIDEFYPGVEIPKIATDKELRLYFTDQVEGAAEFARAAIAAGHKIAWEKYLGEPPPDLDEQSRLQRDLADWLTPLKKEVPNVLNYSILCLGFFSAPPLTLNRDPGVDYKVWLDRQFQFIATHSTFAGLRALMTYQTRNVDEEILRWAAMLFRHYGIEGRNDLLSDQFGFRYRLNHLRNPDFRDGLIHWTVKPDDALCAVEAAPKLGLLQGRFPYNEHWDSALAVESRDAPVELSQTISNLVKGRQYSAKLISVRKSDLLTTNSEAAFHPVELEITGASPLAERASRDVVPSVRPPFTADQPLWIDYHRIVFYADAETAGLNIKISASDSPLLINFIEVQPYLPR